MTLDVIDAGQCKVHVLPVIKGLSSETSKVKAAFEQARPDTVAVSLSKEEVEGLRNMPEDYAPELTRYEEIYAQGLSRFGKVALPPPCYVAALELADHVGVQVVPVDLDEVSYTDLYCASVTGTALFRHSTRTWLLKLRRFGDTPEEFVLAWDRAVNGLEGFRHIEDKRAESMADGILKACEGSRRLLAVIELERVGDVTRMLEGKLAGNG